MEAIKKRYVYINWTEITNEYTPNTAIKEPIIWAFESPGPDYNESTTNQNRYDREEELKRQRVQIGLDEYVKVSAKLRVDRIVSGGDHSIHRNRAYIPMSQIIIDVKDGNFRNAYDDIENVVIDIPYITDEVLNGYRLIIANVLVNSGTYDEFEGWAIDSSGYISNPNI
jgi:hypothetical protein